MKTKKVILITIIGVIIIFILYLALNNRKDINDSDPGPKNAEKFIVEYVDALNENDINILSDLFKVTKDSADMNERLEVYGGRNFYDVDIEIQQDFSYVYRVWIRAKSNDKNIEMYEVIEWEQGKWSIAPLNNNTNISRQN